MSFDIEFSKEFARIFEKLQKKDKKTSEILLKKISEIKNNPTRYKPLSNRLKGYWRVHIASSFVLVYKIVADMITIVDFDHHDRIYQKIEKWKKQS